MKSCCKEALSTGEPEQEPQKKKRGIIPWLKRLGVVGFLFFLFKGIAWLVVFWGGARFLGC